jgi:hypothetical protein
MRERPELNFCTMTVILHADIPVIVVTAKELTGEDRERLNDMIEEVFEKSADTCDALLQRVREAVSDYRVEQ